MTQPIRVLFLCTQNSARSQIAEALLQACGGSAFIAGSAGTNPGRRVHPLAIDVLADLGIEWSKARAKTIDEVSGERWDLVITVCDNAQESCPVFPGRPTTAHWGVPDPAAAVGDEAARRRAFEHVASVLGRRIERLVALPINQLGKVAFERQVRAIGTQGA